MINSLLETGSQNTHDGLKLVAEEDFDCLACVPGAELIGMYHNAQQR